jgi:hypothetical protein
MKGLPRRNIHVKYENLTTYQSKVMTKVKVFKKKVKLQGQISEGVGHDLARRNTHVNLKALPPINQKL